ncbi:MAG TPA: PDZ domain-containing protein [Bryobacteraceae bacterium]|nr:PDZ domain-containing protein [Bryobacteraceae bacterium]
MSNGTKMLWKKFGFAILAIAAAIAIPMAAQTTAPQRGRSATLRELASRGYLGVGVVDLTEDRVKALKLNDDQGVEVNRVEANSAAAKAGLMENDVILEVNGRSVQNIAQFGSTIGDAAPGTNLSLTIWRSGAKKDGLRDA